MSRAGGDDLRKALGWQVSKAAAAMNLKLSRSFVEAGLPLSPEQFRVLSSVARGRDMSQADVARDLGRDGPSLTRLADALVKSDLLKRERRERDRRAYRLVVTEKGRSALSSAERIIEREEGFLRDCLPAEAIPVIESSMARIIKACSEN